MAKRILFGRALVPATVLAFASAAFADPPTIYSQPAHQSPVRAEPGDLLLMPGYAFSATDVVVYEAVADTTQPLVTPNAVPATSNAAEGVAKVVSVLDAPYSLTIRLPDVMQSGQSYALWVRNAAGEWSNGVRINDARPLWISPGYAYQTAQVANLPRYLKVVGRNLNAAPGETTKVRLSGPATFTLNAADDNDPSTAIERYAAKVDLPASLPVGSYGVEVSRDGTSWVPVPDQELEVKPDPSSQPEFPVSAYGCNPDDGQEDASCIIQAIGAASAVGGGVVTFGPGRWDAVSSGTAGVQLRNGILVPVGVSLRGAGTGLTTLVRGANWHLPAGVPTVVLTLQGRNYVEGFTFRDERVYASTDWELAFIGLGKHHLTTAPGDPLSVDDVIITGNVFDKPYVGVSGGYQSNRIFVTYNEFGAFSVGLWLTTTQGNRDSVISHNTFKPGSYLAPPHQGVIASQSGAQNRVDFSNNVVDGTSTAYLYDPVNDAKGWRAGFFWSVHKNVERVLVSENSFTCTGDKAGDGEAIAYDNNHNRFAFSKAQTVTSATPDTVTVPGPLKSTQPEGTVSADYYNGDWVSIAQGPGVGQVRKIVSYQVDGQTARVTFTVQPAWDVIPTKESRLTVAREFWQVYTVDNFVDHRAPLCQKSNVGRPEGGKIGFWGQTADSVVEANRMYDTDGITIQQSYSAEDPGNCPSCGAWTMYQSSVEIRGNLIDGEYEWARECSLSGMYGSHSASPTPVSFPPVTGFGVSVSHNTIRQADGLRGGAITFPLSWHDGPAPDNWKLVDNALIFRNTIYDMPNPAPYSEADSCDTVQPNRIGINLNDVTAWRSVLYDNVCNNVAVKLQDNGTGTVRVCDAGASPNSCECDGLEADLDVTATASAVAVGVGDAVTYTVTVTNHGPATATGVTLTQEPGATVTTTAYAPSQGSCTVETHRCALGNIAAGGSAQVVVTATAAELGAARAMFATAGKQADPEVSNNGAAVNVNVLAEVDLALTMSDAPDPVGPGDVLTYTLGVTNNGPGVASGVVLQDTLPSGATLVSANASQGACGGTASVSCALGDIGAGDGATVTLVISMSTVGTITNAATVSADNRDPNPNNDVASVDTAVVAHGLTGAYFSGTNFDQLVLTRIDPIIDFDWYYGAPDSSMDSNRFSIVWTGSVVPEFSETYTFYAWSDDGVRVYVNGQLVVDYWSNHAARERQGTVGLAAGVPARIEVRYYENTGKARVRLSWSSPSQPKEVVPTGRLFAE